MEVWGRKVFANGSRSLSVSWPLAPGDRGLWDFATLEGWRGRGIYPRLLQAILRAEEKNADCFWIGHRGDNCRRWTTRRLNLKFGMVLFLGMGVTQARAFERLAAGTKKARTQPKPEEATQ